MKFATAINCMDGRIQIPVIRFLQQRFDVEYVDVVTEPGPNRILARQSDPHLVKSILDRVGISVERHHSSAVAVVGHYDCAGNPAPEEEQVLHIREAVEFIRQRWSEIEVIGLWVDEHWKVHEIC
jgi:carbonic anhydrase